MKALSVAICLLALVLSTFAQNKSSKAEKSSKTLFFDDFSASALDRSKWNVVITGFTVNDEQQAYVDSSATIYTVAAAKAEGAQNGALVIEPVYSPNFTTPEGKHFDFLSGRIDSRSKYEFTYGSVSARIKMSEGSGLWPAFWALGVGKWPECGEIDIMEYVGEKDWTSVALHGPGYSGETPLVNKYFFKKNIDVTQWHVYSVDWSKDALLFHVDGQLVYRVTRAMVEHYGAWKFDNPKYIIVNLALGGAYPLKTNGVKAPYVGIPSSTVDLIKQKKAKYVVDWVKVESIE